MRNRVLPDPANGHGGPPGDAALLGHLLREELQVVLRLIEQFRAAEEHCPDRESPACWSDEEYSYIEADVPGPARPGRVDINYTRGHALIRVSRAAEGDGPASG
jgi:hypothetical protein